MCTVIAPGSGYSASGVPATMICTSGRAAVTRAAASRKIAQCRFTSCARLPGNKRSEEHTSELQSRLHLVCRLLLEKKKKRMVNEPIDVLRSTVRPLTKAAVRPNDSDRDLQSEGCSARRQAEPT